MFSVASALWLNPPLIYVIIPWTIAGIACSLWSWRAFAWFVAMTGVALIVMMLIVNQLPDLGGDWPRDEGFFWWASVVYALPALIAFTVLRGIAEGIQERRSGLDKGFE